jgi:hypothetical protein
LHGCCFLHLFLGRPKFLLPFAMCSYGNFGMCVPFVCTKCFVHFHLLCTVISFTFSSTKIGALVPPLSPIVSTLFH